MVQEKDDSALSHTGHRPRDAGAAGDFWAITAYFNPLRFKRRLANYRVFRERLNAPLVAVELAFGGQFELRDGDADILVRLHEGDILWQKERLLNVALQSLPQNCTKVAWLDCDVVFGAPGWAGEASRLLDRSAIAHLYSRANYLSSGWTAGRNLTGDVETVRPSCTSAIASGASVAACIGHLSETREGTPANGLAWAARREILDRHGFFDGCIVGGGDRAIVCAAYRCFDELMARHYMNDRQRDYYMAWAEPYAGAVRGEIDILDGEIFHLWHGDMRERRSRGRHAGLRQFGFDPFSDIVIGGGGGWLWNSEKSDMHDYVRGYFSARREDG
jgi:hypothetical protein